MHGNRRTRLEAVMEVIALHHAGHGVAAGQLDHTARAQWVTPFAVVADLGLGRVQHQASLAVIGLSVDLDLFGRQRWAGAVAARRVANHTGEVADQEDDRVAQILQLAHLVEHHRVTDVDVRRGRIQAQLDAQRRASSLGFGQFFDPVVLRQQLFHAPQGDRQSLSNAIGDR